MHAVRSGLALPFALYRFAVMVSVEFEMDPRTSVRQLMCPVRLPPNLEEKRTQTSKTKQTAVASLAIGSGRAPDDERTVRIMYPCFIYVIGKDGRFVRCLFHSHTIESGSAAEYSDQNSAALPFCDCAPVTYLLANAVLSV